MSTFLRPGRLIALATAALAVIGLGLLAASGNHASCDGPCPPAATVSDTFWFLHRDLGREGGITARMTAMSGTITYPPPDHDEIVPGLVPWAKAGIIVKDGVGQGSRYAALAMTGTHGVRFQYDYTHDVAGSRSATPRWMRLTRSGDTITGAESADGRQWRTVATATLDGLPDTVQVGLFATSPGDLTLRKVMLGGAVEQVRFTQAVGVFDHVTVEGGNAGGWVSEPVGDMNRTDWERFHNASGAVESGGAITVSGTGDIGPGGQDGPPIVPMLLMGLVIAVVIVLVVAARSPGGPAVVAAAAFVTGLVAVGVTLPAGLAILHRNGVQSVLPFWTGVRVAVGLAVVLALCAVFAYGLRAWLRRGWAAILLAVGLVAVPYGVATLPILPDTLAEWLLRVTPAAGFAVRQTVVEYPQVTAHYAPSAGYFPLPWWAGLAVLCAYATIALLLARSVPVRRREAR